MRRPVILVATISAVVAMATWLTCSPLYEDDTAYYLFLARAIRDGTFFTKDMGGRTPLFPCFAALLGAHGRGVLAGNLVLGVLTAVLLFSLFLMLTNSRAIATAVAIIYTLNPSTLRFERTVMTETLACFLVVLGTFLAVKACRSPVGFAGLTAMSTTAFSLAALTRPVFQLLPLATLAAIIGLSRRARLREAPTWKAIVLGLFPFLLLVAGWAWLNYSRFGWFTLSTFSGYHLTNHTGQFMGDVPPQYAGIARIYLRYQEDHLRRTGMRANAIWEAREEITQATGMNDVQLSRLLARLSIRLIVAHPLGYLESVGRSFRRFWRPPVYPRGCSLGDFRRGLGEVLSGRIPWFELFYPYFYLPFSLAYFFSFAWPLIRKAWRVWFWTPGIWVVHLVVIYTAVFSSLAEYGENYRFKFPVEGLTVGVAVMLFVAIFKELRPAPARSNEPQPDTHS